MGSMMTTLTDRIDRGFADQRLSDIAEIDARIAACEAQLMNDRIERRRMVRACNGRVSPQAHCPPQVPSREELDRRLDAIHGGHPDDPQYLSH